MEEIKYYDNKEEHGIVINWNKVFSRYRSLIKKAKLSEPLYDPTTAPVNEAKIFTLMSDRSTGKTTNWILVGMILNQMYGTVTQYVRQYEDMIKPSICNEIFRTILTYNNHMYVKGITDGKYSGIYIRWKKAYFCNYDEKGKPCDLPSDPFLQFLSIDNNFNYKSGYSAPTGDLILFDEFISNQYRINEFVDFLDLCSTIIRKRKTPIIVMMSNTINVNSTYFKELEVSKEVKKLKAGQHKIVETERGTKVYIEIIGLKQTAIKSQVNRLFYGFNNPRLASITGGEVWSLDPAPHIVNSDDDELLSRNFRIDCSDTMLQLDIVRTEDRGLIINCHESNDRIHDDTVVFTLHEIRSNNQVYGLGKGAYCKLIWGLYDSNKWYYDTNETAALVKQYLRNYRQLKYS